MSYPIVILVHGMGTHPLDNMTKEFKAGLNEAAKGFDLENFDIDTHMEIVEFNYSESLDEIRKKLAEDAQEITSSFDSLPGSGNLIGIVHKLIKFQSNFDEDDSIYTHWLDVLLYASFYGEKLRVELAKKINGILKRANGRRIHIVAHSLGTALVNDTLEKFYKVGPEGKDNNGAPYLRAGTDNIKTLWTFANVSNLLHILSPIDTGTNGTVVKSGPTGCTDFLYNVHHELDPFTWFYQYKPEIESGKNFTNKIVRKKNTHSFQEYISDPEVAQYMLAELTDMDSILEPQRLKSCIDKHREGEINGLFDEIKTKTSGLRGGEIQSIPDLLKLINDFKEKVKEIAEQDL
jgi:hypothetical protein